MIFMDKYEKVLWLISFLIVFQMMTGFYLSQVRIPLKYFLYIHIFTGILIFLISIVLIKISGNTRLKRLSYVNMFLILFTGVIGLGFILLKLRFYDIYMPYIHFLIAIGIISNYAVMLGISRTLN
ncbi:hypothetical protein SAMN02745355_1391 [Picrophilus oshimae DSM 9789]|uniref:Trehalose synthase n=2 Tax=Picrophilus oshimae TaxID=46632 RepID=A0A8G2L7W4_PICTO|nr:hypothetical protein SAMN02745355_1391 [Picrophilus oshimae DSM 9789]